MRIVSLSQHSLGFCEWVRMPFGLTNAPATFQRLIESAQVDIIIFSKTPSEHLKCLHSVFEMLDEAGLRLKSGKCEFFKPQLEYLGHVVSKAGIETNPKKIAAIINWPKPVTVTQVQSFLGFCNYYRKFINHYTQLAKPCIN